LVFIVILEYRNDLNLLFGLRMSNKK